MAYELDSAKSPEKLVHGHLEERDQEPRGIVGSRSHQEVFEAAVQSIGSSMRDWTKFRQLEPDLTELLGNRDEYDPAKMSESRQKA